MTRPDDPRGMQDPARSYERAKPEDEPGMGSLKAPKTTPARSPDRIDEAVTNKQPPRQLNAEDVTNERDVNPLPHGEQSLPAPEQPDHSMLEEEPDGWDLAPTDIHNPRDRRHPRTEGKGGVP